jgi:hypothetical protein
MLRPHQIVVGLILLLELLCGECFARSYRPTPRCANSCGPPQSQSKSSQQPAADDKRGTEQSPLIVRGIKSNEEAAKDEQDRKDKAFNDHITIFLSAAVAIGTLLQFSALVAIIRTTRSQLRAYVFVYQSEISDISSDKNLTIKVVVKNFGQTPAYNVIIYWGIDIAAFPLVDELPRASIEHAKMNLGPGGEQILNFRSDEPINVEQRARITQKIAAVYIHGEIKYADAFKIQRFTNFRLYKGGHAGVSGPELSVSIDDNEAN